MELIPYRTGWYGRYLPFRCLDQYRNAAVSYRFIYRLYRGRFGSTGIYTGYWPESENWPEKKSLKKLAVKRKITSPLFLLIPIINFIFPIIHHLRSLPFLHHHLLLLRSKTSSRLKAWTSLPNALCLWLSLAFTYFTFVFFILFFMNTYFTFSFRNQKLLSILLSVPLNDNTLLCP